MPVPAEFFKMAQHVFALENRTVLYVEGMQLLRITVSEIVARQDGQGFQALATVFPTHGLPSEVRSWSFGAGWAYFHATADVVKSTYGGWRILAAPEAMKELAEILKPVPNGTTYLSDYEWEPVQGNRLIKARGSPGPVAMRVLDFLTNH